MWRSQAFWVINRQGLFYDDRGVDSGYCSLNVDDVTNKKISGLGLSENVDSLV